MPTISLTAAIGFVVCLELTGAVYLAFAVPAGVILALLFRRAALGALVGCIAAMVATSLLKSKLPFHYWAHANDFIIEPFYQLKILKHPLEGLLSLLFHIGLPMALIVYVPNLVRRKQLK